MRPPHVLAPVAALVVTLVVVALVGLTGAQPSTVSAAEGDPGDYCTQAPDYPLGWDFNGACRGHDECIDALGRPAPVAERLACDVEFLDALLEAEHPAATVACRDHAFCRALANIYYHVVRYVTVIGGLFEAAPSRVP